MEMNLKIYIVNRPEFDAKNFLSFTHNQKTDWRRTIGATDSEEIVEAAGRICYMSFGEDQSPKSNQEYIRHLIEMGHESVLEHVNWTFLITGVSRAFTHQLVRHRVGFAFSQLSQQYHNETNASFTEPLLIKNNSRAHDIWNKVIQETRQTYRELLKVLQESEHESAVHLKGKEFRRAIYSAARSILPNATETKILVTANARALRYFLKIRGQIPGDEEMRNVASHLLLHLKIEAPSLFFDFHIDKLTDGSPIIVHES